MKSFRGRAVLVTLACPLVLAGCASLPLEQGRAGADALVRSRVAPGVASAAARAARAEQDARIAQDISAWLGRPLSVDVAVRVALLRNPGLQSQIAELGLSAADVFEAGRLHNPQLELALLKPRGDAVGNKASAGLTLGFTDLLLKRATTRIAAASHERTQAAVAEAVLALVSETQRAWVDAVAAAQRVAVRQSIDEVASLGADLAARYQAAGNISRLDLQLQQAAASDARLALQRARADAVDAQSSLQQLLGLSAGESWQLPQALPMPTGEPQLDFAVLRHRARIERLDLIGARRQVAVLEQRLALTRGTRWLGNADLGLALEREPDGSRRTGPKLSLELPLFQQGQGRLTRDAALLVQARAAQQRIEVGLDAELQQSLQRIDIARTAVEGYRAGLIPQREAIVAQLQQRTNQMLTDTFSLLLAKQQEHAAYEGYVDAVQDYWRARVAVLRVSGTQLVAALPVAQEDQP